MVVFLTHLIKDLTFQRTMNLYFLIGNDSANSSDAKNPIPKGFLTYNEYILDHFIYL